ncbi:MAG: Asp-tRNA(Asn)/Glu-tRNA(Gln) amidotransferase subunit GatB, partial [Nanoarchaeota archaeon]
MVKIGLEIHGYLNTKEKLFCNCKAEHGAKITKPNTNICSICTGQPGSKPMLPNKSAINKVIQISLLLNCDINESFSFQRKHYNWPDMPKGFQSTISGAHAIPVGVNGKFLGIGITECHLEEDPAAWNPKTGEIDYNRSGLPLVEIVTEPDFKSSEQVIEWLKQLISTLGYVKAINKKAGLKADVNISLPEKKGARIEIKNVNSLQNIKSVIEYEIKRQEKDVPSEQETRRFDDKKQITTKMRSKEEAQDYRFITEPDLPLIKINKKRINEIKNKLPETPFEKLDKLIKQHKLDKNTAEILTKRLEIVEFFEKVIKKTNINLAVKWIIIELLSVLNYNKKELDEVNIKPEHFIELLELLEEKKITELKAQEILRSWINGSYSLKEKSGEFLQISREKEVKDFIEKVIQE